METVKVVAAIIVKNNRILAAQRGYGECIGKWKFPGGIIKEGETSSEALKREISEELSMKIIVKELITTEEFNYPDFHLSMQCFLCSSMDDPSSIEHLDAKWLSLNDLTRFEWLPADRKVVPIIQERLS